MSDLISRQDAIDAVHEDILLKSLNDSWYRENHEFVTVGYVERTLLAVPSAQQIGWVHIDDIYRLISGHSNYHGDNILAALTCLAEGKEVPNPIDVLELPELRC